MHSFLKLKPKGLSLRDIYTFPLAYGTSPESIKWSTKGDRFAFLWNDDGRLLMDVYVSEGGSPRRLTDAGSAIAAPVEDDERDSNDVAYAEEMRRGVCEFDWLGEHIVYSIRGNLYVLNPSTGESRQVLSGLGAGSLKGCDDGDRIGFLMRGNLWSYRLSSGELKQLTFFGKEGVSVVDYRWSPDGKHVVITTEDISMYEKVRMPDYSPEKEVKIIELRRNNVGKPLSKTRVGIVSAEGGLMSRILLALPGDQPTNDKGIDTGNTARIQSVIWANDSSKVLVGYTDPSYVHYKIVAAEPGKETEPTEVYAESSEPWFEHNALFSTPDSKEVVFASYLDGWRRLYKVGIDGDCKPIALTPSGVDVVSYQVPNRSAFALANACSPRPTKYLPYRVALDGSGWESIDDNLRFGMGYDNHDASRICVIDSAIMSPPSLVVDGKTILKSAHTKFDKVIQPKVQLFSFRNESDQAEVHGKLILPRDFDPSKKYPAVLTCVYAGLGKEGFGRYQPLDAFMANEMGYVVVGIDIRASMGYGRDFFFGYHKKLGIIDAEECASCANYLKTLPYIDGDRIGMWGGSYGGFLTLMTMCNHPGVFHTGISWKPVTDWRNYWDCYTCPRVGRPEDDPETYRATSPVFHAEGLEGNLLIIHGMLDDNVLFQDCAWMIQKLIESKKYFDLMIYPRDNHGLDLRHESLPDCMERFAAYFEEHMGLGPIE